jgi:hypothetical protein
MGSVWQAKVVNLELEDINRGKGKTYGNINKAKTTNQYEFEQNKPKKRPEESRTDFLKRLCQQYLGPETT